MDSGATRCGGPEGLLSEVGSGESGAVMESAKARAASARLSSSLLDSGLSSRGGVAAGAVRCLTDVRGRLPLLELSPLEDRRSLEWPEESPLGERMASPGRAPRRTSKAWEGEGDVG